MNESVTENGRPGASQDAIEAHYDLGNEFFRLWIGPELVYSSALYEGDDDLAAAQLRKLDHHIKAAGATQASNVLDIGCGWGALLNRLVTHWGAKRAVGLTLSPSQASWIRQMALPNVEVQVESWRDHKPAKPYDAIISVGAFEHFCHSGMKPADKLQSYRDFFSTCHGMLADGGRLSLQTIAAVKPLEFVPSLIPEKIFPESEIPLIWEPVVAAEGPFELLALRNDADHYYRTLRQWEKNLTACRDQAVKMVGEETVRDFQQYLRISAFAFKRNHICLLRMSFAKR
ncbi:MAG TPA: cyclopropane-fatty-acyl-phospholipid synthase family protein [Xanthobacteraceae bacterium]|jgi:cyclopropane-fatty-acyl-phospholipid synthase|nr:cyclopropane-fatty-acyl-phospholipid synthase family protein [Xanthobacteraceae bacterium]